MDGWPHLREGALALRESFDRQGLSELICLPPTGHVDPGLTVSTLDFYDVELRAHHEHLRAAYEIGRGQEVLDIGCGTGRTTREAGRAAAPARVVGIDVSESMLERARQLTEAEQLDNVHYELGDAQVHPFDPAGFDVAISRFGTMFFSDPVAGFANIAAALRSASCASRPYMSRSSTETTLRLPCRCQTSITRRASGRRSRITAVAPASPSENGSAPGGRGCTASPSAPSISRAHYLWRTTATSAAWSSIRAPG